jgi:hypothetical protein
VVKALAVGFANCHLLSANCCFQAIMMGSPRTVRHGQASNQCYL